MMGIIQKIKRKINNIREYGIYIITIQIVHKIFYRRRLNPRVSQFLSEERLMRYLDKYSYIWKNREHIKTEQLSVNEDIIWTMWLQGEDTAPLLIKRCIESIRSNSAGRKVVVLDESNINSYVEIPEYIVDKYKKGYITRTHFSDIIRLIILKTYGGCWLDSTVFISDEENMNELTIKKVLEQPFFMIKAPLTLNQFRISSSWIIRANKNDPIINTVCDLLLEYWKNEFYLRAYFLIHICFAKVVAEDDELAKLWDDIPYFDDSPSNFLRTQFSKEYSKEKWNLIKGMTSIHKLNWKLCQEGGSDFGGPGSFCQHFLDGDLK